MQGIHLAELKILLDYLKELKELESYNLPKEKLQVIAEKEAELKRIYSNYRISLQQVSENIQSFEYEKHAVRKFLKESKLLLKNNKKTVSRRGLQNKE